MFNSKTLIKNTQYENIYLNELRKLIDKEIIDNNTIVLKLSSYSLNTPKYIFHWKGNSQYGDKMYTINNGNFIINDEPTTTSSKYNTFTVFDGFARAPVEI